MTTTRVRRASAALLLAAASMGTLAGCSDEDGDGARFDEEIRDVENSVDDLVDDIQDGADELEDVVTTEFEEISDELSD